jgi:hypothetical protein
MSEIRFPDEQYIPIKPRTHGAAPVATIVYSNAIVGLPMEAAARKAIPLATGLLDYFPDACAAVAELSRIGNEQHNPGQPMHWAREKSTDHADCVVRHLMDRGKYDSDGVRHSAKTAWRALALLQLEIEASKGKYDAVHKARVQEPDGPTHRSPSEAGSDPR